MDLNNDKGRPFGESRQTARSLKAKVTTRSRDSPSCPGLRETIATRSDKSLGGPGNVLAKTSRGREDRRSVTIPFAAL